MLRYIDTHAHLTSDELYEDIDALLNRAEKEGMRAAINICTEEEQLTLSSHLESRFPHTIFSAAGVHPHDADKQTPFFSTIAKSTDKLVAIGETGLDYHYSFATKKGQQDSLLEHVALAKTSSKPLIIHCREAFSDLFCLVPQDMPAVVHCFTGSMEEAKKSLDCNWMLSFSGVLTFKKSEELRNIARYVPLERMLIETDAPYLAPQTKRGKRNEPSFLPETLLALSAIKGLSSEITATTLYHNSIRFFSLPLET